MRNLIVVKYKLNSGGFGIADRNKFAEISASVNTFEIFVANTPKCRQVFHIGKPYDKFIACELFFFRILRHIIISVKKGVVLPDAAFG